MAIEIKPFDWQMPAVDLHAKFLAQGTKLHLNTSKTGRGKTIHVLSAIQRLNRPVFVLCPASVTDEWKLLSKRMGVDCIDAVSFQYAVYHKKGKPYGHWFNNKFHWTLPDGCILIIDEIHKCSGQDSKSSLLLRGAAESVGLQIVGLSATAADSPLKMKALGYAFDLHQWDNFRHWTFRYSCKPGEFGGLQFEGGPEDIKKMKAPIADKIFSVDFPEGFPKMTIQTRMLSVKNSRSIDTAYMKDLKNKELNDRKLPIVSLIRSRQKSELLKVPSMFEIAYDDIESGNAVIAFFNFKESRNMFREYCEKKKISFSEIHGGQSKSARKEAQRQFQENEVEMCLVMIQAGGQSISLHDTTGEFPRTSLISPSFDPVELVQALGRIHRATQKSPCVNRICFAAGTVEVQVRRKVEAKVDNIEALNSTDLLIDLEAKRGIEEPKLPESTTTTTTQETMSDKDKTVDHSQRGHSKYSPSGLKPKAACPGFENDNSKPPHPVTLEGTMLHEVLDGASPPEPLEEEQEECVELCRDVKAGEIEDFPEAEKMVQEEVTCYYLRTAVDNDGNPLEQAGNMDVLILGSKSATLIDWKFGYRKVDPAKKNWQGKGYALAVMETHPHIDSVKVVFVQPRCDYLTSHTFTRKRDFAKIHKEILEVVYLCEEVRELMDKYFNQKFTQQDMKDLLELLNPSEYNCKYCAHVAKCPAVVPTIKEVATKAGIKFEEFDVNNLEEPKDLGRYLTLLNFLEEFVENGKRLVRQWHNDAGVVPEGFTAVKRAGVRSITDSVQALRVIENEITVEQYLEAARVSLPKLEKAYAQATGLKAKAAKETLEIKLLEADLVSSGMETVSFRKNK